MLNKHLLRLYPLCNQRGDWSRRAECVLSHFGRRRSEARAREAVPGQQQCRYSPLCAALLHLAALPASLSWATASWRGSWCRSHGAECRVDVSWMSLAFTHLARTGWNDAGQEALGVLGQVPSAGGLSPPPSLAPLHFAHQWYLHWVFTLLNTIIDERQKNTLEINFRIHKRIFFICLIQHRIINVVKKYIINYL